MWFGPAERSGALALQDAWTDQDVTATAVLVSDTQAEAYVEKGGSSLTVNLSGFELDAAGYRTAALDLVDANLD